MPPWFRSAAPSDYAGTALTYPHVGATAEDPMPAGYRHVDRTVVLGTGRDVHERAAEALLTWQVHRGLGARLTADRPRAEPDAIVVLTFGQAPFAVTVPCRVVHVIAEPDADGFAYGTLPGHPETGEEAFIVRTRPDGQVTFTVRAFSRHSAWFARVLPPAARRAQELATRRYLRTMKRLAAGTSADRRLPSRLLERDPPDGAPPPVEDVADALDVAKDQ